MLSGKVVRFLLYFHVVSGYSVLNNKYIDREATLMRNNGFDSLTHIEWSDDAFGSNMVNATSFPLDVVYDPRWLASPSYNGIMDFTFTESASFSVSGQSKSEMFIQNDPYPLHFDLAREETFEKWVHYTLLSQDGCLLLYKNCDLLKNWTGIENETFKVIVKGDGSTQFKKHTYQYQKWTKITTNDEESSNLIVYSYRKSVLTLRVNMCESCYLKIKTPNASLIYIDNDHLADSCTRWHILNLTNNNGKNIFTFYRRIKLRGENQGYWKVDTSISRTHNKETWSFNREVAVIIIILLAISISAVTVRIILANYFVTDMTDSDINEEYFNSLIDNSDFDNTIEIII